MDDHFYKNSSRKAKSNIHLVNFSSTCHNSTNFLQKKINIEHFDAPYGHPNQTGTNTTLNHEFKIDCLKIPEIGARVTHDEEYSNALTVLQSAVHGFFNENVTILWKTFYMLISLLYTVHFIAAMRYEFGSEASIRQLVITIIVMLYIAFRLIKHFACRNGWYHKGNCAQAVDRLSSLINHLRLDIVLPLAVSMASILYIIVEIAASKPRNLISLGGMSVFMFLLFIFSSSPAEVKWRPVVWGVLLQFVFAVIILRTSWGFGAFAYIGERMMEFLSYTDSGSMFVFGELYENHFFAFKILPVVVFFSAFVSMLYYLGFMQFIVRNIGRFLAFCLDTSPVESLNAAGNIFLGQSEAALLIRPFIDDMTKSEIHAVLTGGFSTIAGAVMAAFISYGVPANHLLSASVMSAPAALAISKLFYPETERVINNSAKVYNLKPGGERNIIEAVSNGATQSIRLVANIAVNVLVFVALLKFVNATLVWFGERIGMYDTQLTFQFICSYTFYPISFLMGVDSEDLHKMGELIGTKIFLNEFYAYAELSKYIENRLVFKEYLANYTQGINGTGEWHSQFGGIYLEDTQRFLDKGLMTERSVVVATYALCGFSNLSSMGLMLGALGGMAPRRRPDISSLVFRAMIAGNVACFMTACIAGLLSP